MGRGSPTKQTPKQTAPPAGAGTSSPDVLPVRNYPAWPSKTSRPWKSAGAKERMTNPAIHLNNLRCPSKVSLVQLVFQVAATKAFLPRQPSDAPSYLGPLNFSTGRLQRQTNATPPPTLDEQTTVIPPPSDVDRRHDTLARPLQTHPKQRKQKNPRHQQPKLNTRKPVVRYGAVDIYSEVAGGAVH